MLSVPFAKDAPRGQLPPYARYAGDAIYPADESRHITDTVVAPVSAAGLTAPALAVGP